MDERSPSAKASPASPDALPFDAALARLEDIVRTLEQGDLELETALEAFEQGVQLSRRCATQLEQAERRIEALVREGEEGVVRPFEAEDEG